MHTFIANYQVDIFATKEEVEENKKRIQDIFNLPFPDQLKVSLSQESIKKISNFYRFMKAEKVTTIEFYIGHGTDINSFEPMNNDLCFNSNHYIDYGDALFKTFKTDSCLVKIEKLHCHIVFSFFFSNSYMEESFDFTLDIKKILEVC